MAAITASAWAWVMVPSSTSGASASWSRPVLSSGAGVRRRRWSGAVVSGVVGGGLGGGAAAPAGEDQAGTRSCGEPGEADAPPARVASSWA